MVGLCISPLWAQEPGSGFGRIRVAMSGLKSDAGDLRIALFNSRAGFPGKSELAGSTAVISAEGGVAHLCFLTDPIWRLCYLGHA